MLYGNFSFLSDEWPEYFGTEFNDSYSIAFKPKIGGVFYVSRGNLNSSSWEDGILGYSGLSKKPKYTIDLINYSSSEAKIEYKVSNISDFDFDFDSVLLTTGFRGIREKQYFHHSSGAIDNIGRVLTGFYGQGLKLKLKNLSLFLAIMEVDAGGGEKQSVTILPGGSKELTFGTGGGEPLSQGHKIKITSPSDVFLVSYSAESTWVDGMPHNSCNY